jgi:glycosyltransferase involved in cell wall biosynthesis
MAISPPLVIACVVPLPPYPAGSAVVCAEVLRELAARGHRIRSIAPVTEDTQRQAEDFDRRHPALGITRFVVPYFEMFAFTADDTATEEYRAGERAGVRDALRSRLAAERVDVVLVGREIYGWYVDDILRAAELPFVLISHGGPTTAIVNGAWPAARAHRLLAGMSSADVVVSVARHWRHALGHLGLPRITHIANPVDLARFVPGPRDPELARALRIAPDDVVVLHASNLSAVKRISDLIAAAEVALRRDRRLVFVVLGDGPERATAEDDCRRRGLTGAFRFRGWVDHDATPAYFRLADVVVVTSAHETQSLVCLEAQASGRYLVATDISGAREIVIHQQTGLLVPLGDVIGLADALHTAAGDPARRAAVGAAARQHVEPHALPRIVTAYEQVLLALATAAPTPSGKARLAADPDGA